MSDAGWLAIDGVDPRKATFPAAARYNDARIWIFRSGGGYFGVAYSCPHAYQTMDTGEIVENGTMIRCSYHHYAFKLSDGQGVNCPGYTLAVYEVKEEAGRFCARARSRSSRP